MLHAFTRNKSKAYTRYLGIRDPSEPRVSSEDEITSIIFGPLEFLSASDNWTLWKQVLASAESNSLCGPLPSDYFQGYSPVACTFEFWPRKNGIEPDLVIRFLDAQGEPRSLLVELKWDAGVSGADQLEKQWSRYQSGQHGHSLHVFIGKRVKELLPDSQAWVQNEPDGVTVNRLRAVRWHEFKHEISKLAARPDTSAPLKRWSVLIGEFLGHVGIRPFVGFHAAIQLANAIADSDNAALKFWLGTKE
ncbi:hypothetical protein [Pseudoduganella lutea]|uniref:Uncharacterized protein n=1 Tax=Pseudoduganella lutea TaxID=321985 RepID=A0A4P6KSG9_9BURK|nr:hypothetical protein [Pseudoduganella lutea]QBE62059.1 hypothetical protein EWM63_02890 [Pseudoduganella lutea]